MKLPHLINYLLFLLTAFSYSKAYSQSKDLAYYENNLVDIHNEIDVRLNKFSASLAKSLSYDSLAFNKDSVEYFIEMLDREFTSLITDNPKTIDYPFKKLVDSHICIITTSVDGNFRIYNLNSWLLLTEIYQWRENGNVFTKVHKYEKDSSGLCRDIFTVPVNGKPLYLPLTLMINWPELALQSVAAWRINGSSLEAVTLFKNSSEKLDRIDIPFSFGNFIEEEHGRLRALISYDNKQKKFYVPFANGFGMFTNSYFIYELKDDYLEFTNIGEMKQEKTIVKPHR
jgi:hypothetical protein